jgi:tetratricopeptide (TPR) repeat protein
VLLGGICQARHDRAGARAAYARALSISPNLASAHYGMGAVLMTEAAYAQAVEHFRFASMNNPGDVQAQFKLAASLLEAGKTEDAVALLRSAVRADPQRYATSLKLMLSSGRGRFWLRPSAAARALS